LPDNSRSGLSMPAVLEFHAISKCFGQHQVLANITLSVQSGELLTLLGPSGSGKTTLLRLAGGFEHPDSGRILLGGQDVSHLPPYQRRVNTVFQSYALFPHLNVLGNVAFGLQNLRLGQAETEQRVRAALDMVQLAGCEGRFPSQLSGGQQQRVALARALVMRPAVLLLDEPFGALDAKLRLQMQRELKALQRRLGLAFVFVTHDQEEALSLSDRVALLHQGGLEQLGRPDELYGTPHTRFAAEFMGFQNILELTTIEPQDIQLRCTTDLGETFWVGKPAHAVQNRRFLALRSGHISITRLAPANGRANVLKGRIRDSSYLGDSVLWNVEAAGRTWQVSQSLQKADGIEPISAADEVFLSWDSSCGVLVS